AVVSVTFALHATAQAAKLSEETDHTKAALHTAQQERTRAERRLAESYLDRALALCDKDADPALGLLWLGRGLGAAPQDAADLEWTIRMNLAGWGREVWSLRNIYVVGDSPSTARASWGAEPRLIILDADLRRVQVLDGRTGRPVGPAVRSRVEVWVVALS